MYQVPVQLPTANVRRPVLRSTVPIGSVTALGAGPFTVYIDGNRFGPLSPGMTLRVEERPALLEIESETAENVTVLVGRQSEGLYNSPREVRLLDSSFSPVTSANRLPTDSYSIGFLNNWLFTTPAQGPAADVTPAGVKYFSASVYGRDAAGAYGTPATAWDVRFEGTHTTAANNVWTEILRHASSLGHADGEIVFPADAIPRAVRAVRARLVSVTLGSATDIQCFLYSVV